MKYIKLFEQFIKEEAMKPGKDSEIVIDDVSLENGKTISSAEIVGAIVNSETELELEDFFYTKYGQNAFKQGELATIKKYWSEYQTETKEAESEAEKEAKGGDSEEGGLDLEI